MVLDATTIASDPIMGIVVMAVVVLAVLLLLKFILKLAWRLFTLGCFVVVFLALAAALGAHFFK